MSSASRKAAVLSILYPTISTLGLNDLVIGNHHRLFEPRVDQIQLICAVDNKRTLILGEALARSELNRLEHAPLGRLFVSLAHSSESDV